jgi:hypothetical protein
MSFFCGEKCMKFTAKQYVRHGPTKGNVVRLSNTREGLETFGANQEVYLNEFWGGIGMTLSHG